MKYKLKEGVTLTKKDLINTRWDFPNLSESESFQESMFSLGVEWNGVPRQKMQLTHIEIFAQEGRSICKMWSGCRDNLKEMKFDDYFEEDRDMIGEGFKVKQEAVKLLKEKIPPIGIIHIDGDKSRLELIPRRREIESMIPKDEIVNNFLLKGSFMWAVEQMKQGKITDVDGIKVKAELATGNLFIYVDTSSELQRFYPNIKQIEATNWEIYEEDAFGEFQILNNGKTIKWNEYGEKIYIHSNNFDDLEKAIKRAREK